MADLAAQGGASFSLVPRDRLKRQSSNSQSGVRCITQPAMVGGLLTNFGHHSEKSIQRLRELDGCLLTGRLNCFRRKKLRGWTGTKGFGKNLSGSRHEAAPAGHLRD